MPASPAWSVSRSIFALVDDRDRAYFGLRGGEEEGSGRFLSSEKKTAPRSSAAAMPPSRDHLLVKQLKTDEAVAEADTLS